jgi:hypothetical protein
MKKIKKGKTIPFCRFPLMKKFKNGKFPADNFSFYFEFSSAFNNEFRSARCFVIFFKFWSADTNDIRSTQRFVIFSAFHWIIIFFDLLSFFYDFTSEYRNAFTSAGRVVNFSDFWSVLKMNFSRPDVLTLFFEFLSEE